jgi:gas vesicle protein
VIGLVAGAISALWYLPRSGKSLRETLLKRAEKTTKSLQAQVDNIVPPDSVAESIAQGKAAARRRRDELGLGR